jgi:PAS domain-containing protein
MVTDTSATDSARLHALIERQRQELEALRSGSATRSIQDLATGILMDQLGCSAGEARQQLLRLAAESGSTATEMAAQISGQPALAISSEAVVNSRLSLAWAAVESAGDGSALAAALLEEALAPLGAAAVGIWLTEPDGGLQLVGEAGLGEREASSWRRIPPQMQALPLEAVRLSIPIWWPAGRAPDNQSPLIGRWPDGARAALPLRDSGVTTGAMVICWPAPLAQFATPLQRELGALADLAAQALNTRLPGDAGSGEHRLAWLFALLGDLFDTVAALQAVRDTTGTVIDFRVAHVSSGFRDQRGRGRAELVGRPLLEVYDGEVSTELFDRCVQVLATGEPYVARWVSGSPARPRAIPIPEVRIVPLYDGVVIALREASEADRLAALLQHAQRLGRIGSWEEDLVTGETYWAESAFGIFGRRPGRPVPLADLDSMVPDEDHEALHHFRDSLLRERIEAAAVFRIVRSDDGSVRQLRAYAEPVVDPAGAVIAVRGAYQDVSADYHTRLAFAATREQLADTEVRAAEEHRLALRLQQAITPRSGDPVEAAGLEVAARYRPSGPGTLVSGDWYDTVLLPSKEVLLVVGDIAGHGLDAATGMVAVRNGLRGLAITGAGPGALLGWLNSAACHFTDGVIATAICGLYNPADRSLRWARAGHLPPILVRDGRAEALALPEGMLLGADPDAQYDEITTTLKVSDMLLLFTDGLIERRDQPIDNALNALMQIASRPISDIGRYADYVAAEAASDTQDDACLVAVRVS